MTWDTASFRDPAGRVLHFDGRIFRTIAHAYEDEWTTIQANGLLRSAQELGWMVAHKEVPAPGHVPLPPQTWKVIEVEPLPFVSYPYEWCFSQLKQAALLTLDLHLLALRHEHVLKDATAYNIQFMRGKPICIDLLSFERWKEGTPWEAYGQFCRHFLAPLALMHYNDLRFGLLSRQWIDGIPLDLACHALPWRSFMSAGSLMHIHLHARMCQKHGGSATDSNKKPSLSLRQMENVALSLRTAAENMHPPHKDTEWGDYYTDTNYSDAAMEAKQVLVNKIASAHPGRLALDLGANIGKFTTLLAPHFETVLSTDVDPLAVERHFQSHPAEQILPLILDVASPSPALGWATQERPSFSHRCQADMLLALALCHHLRMSAGIPLAQQAAYFADILTNGGQAVVEFVPKEDSQVQRLLASREDIFTDYTLDAFRDAFRQAGFCERSYHALPDSSRTMHVWEKI